MADGTRIIYKVVTGYSYETGLPAEAFFEAEEDAQAFWARAWWAAIEVCTQGADQPDDTYLREDSERELQLLKTTEFRVYGLGNRLFLEGEASWPYCQKIELHVAEAVTA